MSFADEINAQMRRAGGSAPSVRSPDVLPDGDLGVGRGGPAAPVEPDVNLQLREAMQAHRQRHGAHEIDVSNLFPDGRR